MFRQQAYPFVCLFGQSSTKTLQLCVALKVSVSFQVIEEGEGKETSPFTKSSIEEGGREGDISLHVVLHWGGGKGRRHLLWCGPPLRRGKGGRHLLSCGPPLRRGKGGRHLPSRSPPLRRGEGRETSPFMRSSIEEGEGRETSPFTRFSIEEGGRKGDTSLDTVLPLVTRCQPWEWNYTTSIRLVQPINLLMITGLFCFLLQK